MKKYYTQSLYFENNLKKKSKNFKIGNYMLMNDYILLDIINTSEKRKIFFTYDFDMLTKLLTQRGIVFELTY